MLKKILFFFMIGSVLSFPVFGQIKKETNNNSVNKTIAANPTSTIYVEDTSNIVLGPKDQKFVIKLKSNPTTGYSWFLHDYNERVVIPIKHAVLPAEQKLIGAPGYEEFTFKINPKVFTPQATTIRLLYLRPSQGVEGSSMQVFHVMLAARMQ